MCYALKMPNVQNLERRILIPNVINKRLRRLAEKPYEIAGVLFYSAHRDPQHLDFEVEALYFTGIGSEHAVEIDTRREEVVEEFLLSHRNYGSVRWHTHSSRNTMPSEDDVEHYRERIARNPRYIGMIIGSGGKKRLIAYRHGEHKTTVRTIATPSDFYEKERKVLTEVGKIATRFGYADLAPQIRIGR